MAALKNAVGNAYDDLVAVNIGGSWSDQESLHNYGGYTYVPWATFAYSGIFLDIAPGSEEEGTVQEDIRVFPRVPKERVYP